jgi:hypothetical protein
MKALARWFLLILTVNFTLGSLTYAGLDYKGTENGSSTHIRLGFRLWRKLINSYK